MAQRQPEAVGAAVSVPEYRFATLLGIANRLADQAKSLSDSLLGTLEKSDSEALSQLQNEQEGIVLKLTTALKQEQIDEAEDGLGRTQAPVLLQSSGLREPVLFPV